MELLRSRASTASLELSTSKVQKHTLLVFLSTMDDKM